MCSDEASRRWRTLPQSWCARWPQRRRSQRRSRSSPVGVTDCAVRGHRSRGALLRRRTDPSRVPHAAHAVTSRISAPIMTEKFGGGKLEPLATLIVVCTASMGAVSVVLAENSRSLPVAPRFKRGNIRRVIWVVVGPTPGDGRGGWSKQISERIEGHPRLLNHRCLSRGTPGYPRDCRAAAPGRRRIGRSGLSNPATVIRFEWKI